jgi:hypothetical protein
MPRRKGDGREDASGENGGAGALPPPEQALSYTVDNAKLVTGWPEKFLYDELKSRRVKSYKLGRRRFIDAASLRARVAELIAEEEGNPIRRDPRFHEREGHYVRCPRGSPENPIADQIPATETA